MNADEIPGRADSDYDQKVLSADICAFASATDDASKRTAIEAELEICRQLAKTWSDCDKVYQDCDKLLKDAREETSKPSADFARVHEKLQGVRRRLAKAWRSERSTRLVTGLSIWLFLSFVVCVFSLVWWRLLPGWAPKVATTNPNVAFLTASFVVGAIGGIFDAVWSISKNYAERSFDPDHWLWHFVSPLLGGIVGAAVFLLFVAGFVSTTGSAVTTSNVTGSVESNSVGVIEFTTKTAIILALVFLAGFKQITVVDFFERIVAAVFNKTEQSKDNA